MADPARPWRGLRHAPERSRHSSDPRALSRAACKLRPSDTRQLPHPEAHANPDRPRLYRTRTKTVVCNRPARPHGIEGMPGDRAVRKGVLVNNPAGRADAPRKVDPEVGRALSVEEVTRLLAGFTGAVYHPIVATAVMTGARLSEILALPWSAVNFAANK